MVFYNIGSIIINNYRINNCIPSSTTYSSITYSSTAII